VRRALPAFDAHQQQRLAIRELYSARIEDTVRGIRPMIGSKDRVIWMASEELLEAIVALDGGLRLLRRARLQLSSSEGGDGVPAPRLPQLNPDTPVRAIKESLI
jgi:hypothetical protein